MCLVTDVFTINVVAPHLMTKWRSGNTPLNFSELSNHDMTTPTPRIINALNEVINIKGRIMDIASTKVPHITFIDALPHFTWYRHSYAFYAECLEVARNQAVILQQIIDGVPCFYMKKCQAEINYHPIFKYEWDDKIGHYVCHRRIYHYENHQKVYEWVRGGDVSISYIEQLLNSYSCLASLTPMTNNYNFNME